MRFLQEGATSMERPDRIMVGELRTADLFADLGSQEFRRIVDCTRVIRLEDGERLFEHGDPARHFFRLRTGLLKLSRSSPTGREKIIEIIHPGETFAQAVMFMNPDGGYPVSAEAIEPSVLLSFDSDVMRGVLRGSVGTCFRVFASLSNRLRHQVDEIEKLALHSAVSRLADYLVEHVPRGKVMASEDHLPAPKNVIAARLGIQPETFSRVAARLMKEHLIRVQGQNIVLLDIDGLRARAAE